MLGKYDSLFTACQVRASQINLRDSPGRYRFLFCFLASVASLVFFFFLCVSGGMLPVCLSKDSSVDRKAMYMHVPVRYDGTEGTCTVTVMYILKSGKENP